eukprot:GFUD01020632.1.p1 GENE.GFUD01020632.1~~GFUD01020632.1.p1  ORF type:complete len:455 (+),score=119.78 GFUD01020632.1:39-1403(+)
MKVTKLQTFLQKRSKFTLSNYFQPFDVIPFNQSKVYDPQEESTSARLLSSYGIVRQAGPGTYHLLPLGLRAQNKLENLIDEELQKIGCQKVAMPHLTQGSLWKRSGRLESMGSELISFKDRHRRSQVLSPTHEESVTSMMASLPFLSERELPIKLYQTGAKFRDEIRPKFGLIRANEFTMKDLYTFDRDNVEAKKTYEDVTEAYRNIFSRLGVPFVVVAGDTGQIGGSLSHEYHYPAAIGQDSLLLCKGCGAGRNAELGEEEVCRECSGEMSLTKGIEVGHTFLLGEKYSKPFNAVYKTDSGTSVPYQMGCYGIGVSRLMAASLEVLSSQTELRWPEEIAPFTVAILAPKGGSKEAAAIDLVELIHRQVGEVFADDVIVDDREKLTVGKKLREARKTGYPYVILFGKKCLDSDPKLELHILNTNTVLYLRPGEVIEHLKNDKQKRAVTVKVTSS